MMLIWCHFFFRYVPFGRCSSYFSSTKWKLSNFGLTSSLKACKQTETMNVYKTNNLSLIPIDRRLFATFFFCIRMECQSFFVWVENKFQVREKKNAMIRDSEWRANKRQAPWRRRHTFVMQFKNVLTIKITSIILLPKKKLRRRKLMRLMLCLRLRLMRPICFPRNKKSTHTKRMV